MMDKISELKRWIKNIFKTQLEPEDQFNRLIKKTYRNLNTGEISEEFYDGNEFRYKFRVFRYFEKDAKVDDHLEITRGPHYTRIDIIWVTDDEINQIKEQLNKHLRFVVFNRGMLDRVLLL